MPTLVLKAAHHSTMSACPSITKKHKVRPLYDGSDCVSHGHQLGVHSLHITIPRPPHPLNLAATLEVATSGCNLKHPCYHKVTCAQFSTYEE